MTPDVCLTWSAVVSYQRQRLRGCYIIDRLLFQCFSVNNYHGNTHVCHSPFQCRTDLVKLIIQVQRWSDPIRSLPRLYRALFSLDTEQDRNPSANQPIINHSVQPSHMPHSLQKHLWMKQNHLQGTIHSWWITKFPTFVYLSARKSDWYFYSSLQYACPVCFMLDTRVWKTILT